MYDQQFVSPGRNQMLQSIGSSVIMNDTRNYQLEQTVKQIQNHLESSKANEAIDGTVLSSFLTLSGTERS
jgi:uncharacterized protein YrrD